MKKPRIIALVLSLLMFSSFAIAGCSNEKEPAETDSAVEETEATDEEKETTGATETTATPVPAGSIAESVLEAFNSNSSSDIDTICSAVESAGESFGYDLEIDSISEGYLNGFNEDITGFTAGYCISPIVGSIPYVTYVFETDDPDALLSLLNESSNPAWNICTEADDTVGAKSGNFVFFAMVPSN